MRRLSLAIAAAAMALPTAVVPMAPASARPHYRNYDNNYYHGRVWRDSRGRYRCKRSNGTTGLLIGGAGGALIGRSIDTHGSRATGTILGAAAGALLGREIERSNNKYRCR